MQGDIGHDTYFIKSGTVQIGDGPCETKTLSDGKYFGDESLVNHAPRSYSVRAVTHTDMFVLRDSDLEEVIAFYQFNHLFFFKI